MNGFERAVVRGVGALLVALSIGNACASEFSDKVERVFSPSVFESAHESGSTGTVDFKVPDRHPDYFETGDKANKVFAIDSVRIFRDLPKLNRLIFKVQREGFIQTLDVTRSQVEQHYELSLSDLAANPSNWREDFIQPFDNRKSRADFAERFVTQK
jgi:hypothetical protein